MKLVLQVVRYQSINTNDGKAGGRESKTKTLIRFQRKPLIWTEDALVVRLFDPQKKQHVLVITADVHAGPGQRILINYIKHI